ncbi:MAG: hypothetical protein WC223_05135 [Bacteroidales bacterium]|jgi:hypothetical protein
MAVANINNAPVKAYSPCELAHLYKVTYKSFHKWLKPFIEKIGKRSGRYYTFKQVRKIFYYLGEPSSSNAHLLLPFFCFDFSDIFDFFSF